MFKRKKPQTVEDKINVQLSGEVQKNALDFVAFLKANECGDSCVIVVAKKPAHISPWTIFFNACEFDGEDSANDDLKEAAWAHAHICDHFASGGKRCGCGDQPGFRGTMFGKDFENLCKCPLQFTNPDVEAMEEAKRLLLMLKKETG